MKLNYYIKPMQPQFHDEKERQHAYINHFEGSAQGKKILMDILITAGFFDASHVAGDTHETANREGKKHVCRDILNILQIELEESYD